MEAVSDGASRLHAVSHPRWTAGEHSNLRQLNILLLQTVEEQVEIRTSEMGDGAQPCEETAAGQLLEVPLTDVLKKEHIQKGINR